MTNSGAIDQQGQCFLWGDNTNQRLFFKQSANIARPRLLREIPPLRDLGLKGDHSVLVGLEGQVLVNLDQE